MAKLTKLDERAYDLLNLIFAALLFISPWVIPYSGETAAAWNAWIVGVLVAALAAIALMWSEEWPEWVNAVLGAWTVVAPWILGFATNGARWTQLILGALVLVCAAWGAWSLHRPTTKATA
jgi:hypothetical protein